MNYFAACILLFLGLSSCTTYQYTVLKSDLEKAEGTNDFYYQDSLMRIDFDFWGENFPTSIFVENTSNTDLFLDLQRTLFFENDVIVSDAIPKRKGSISGYVRSTGNLYAYSETSSSENTAYIPSGKKIELHYSVFSSPFNKEIQKKGSFKTQQRDGQYIQNSKYIFPNGSAPQFSVRFYFRTAEADSIGYPIECTFYPGMIITNSILPNKFEFRGSDVFYTKSK